MLVVKKKSGGPRRGQGSLPAPVPWPPSSKNSCGYWFLVAPSIELYAAEILGASVFLPRKAAGGDTCRPLLTAVASALPSLLQPFPAVESPLPLPALGGLYLASLAATQRTLRRAWWPPSGSQPDDRFRLPPEASCNANFRELLMGQQEASRAPQADRGEWGLMEPTASSLSPT